MRLNKKVIGILTVFLVVLSVLLYASLQSFILNGFLKVENEKMSINISRVEKSIKQVEEALGVLSEDWAHWPELYYFVSANSGDFIKKNVTVEALMNANIDLMVMLNGKGKVVFETYVDDINKHFVAVPAQVERFIQKKSPLMTRPNSKHNETGIISLNQGLMLVSASQIIIKNKPANGILLVGREFSKDLLATLSHDTNLSLNIFLLKQINQNRNLKRIFDEMYFSKNDHRVEIKNNNLFFGYVMLRDIHHEPVALIQVEGRRSIFQSGEKSIYTFLIAFIVSGILLTLFIWYLLRKVIIERVESLDNQIESIAKNNDYDLRIKDQYNDELSLLTNQFNLTMSAIQKMHVSLQEKIEQLAKSEEDIKNQNLRLINEMKERERIKSKADSLHKQLMLSEKQAGMADSASSALDEIDSLLKNLKNRVAWLSNRVPMKNLQNIYFLQQMEKNNKTQDLIKNLELISKSIEKEEINYKNEIKSMQVLTDKIENLVVNQNQFSNAELFLAEKISVSELVDEALEMCNDFLVTDRIEVFKEISPSIFVISDKSKLLQVLISVIKNARDAIYVKKSIEPGYIKIKAKEENGLIKILIADNGVGIAEGDLLSIFSHTVCDRQKGFSLHVSILALKPLGGKLEVKSAGLEMGATFILTLPYENSKNLNNESGVSNADK